MHPSTDRTRGGRPIRRRAVLAGAAIGGVAALAGCLDDSNGEADAPEPIDIDSDQACDNCTMPIGNFTGPAGQAFYDDPTALLDADRPAQFCSSHCAYTFTLDTESEQAPEIVYLTDYSTVDPAVDDGGNAPTVARHLAADGFGPAADLTLVVDSEIRGSMGRTLLGFSNADDAESFQAEYGGEPYEHDEVSSELLQSLMG